MNDEWAVPFWMKFCTSLMPLFHQISNTKVSCPGCIRFPMQVLIIRYDKQIKDHVTLGGSYCKKNRAHACSDWLEHHGRAWKDGGNTDY